MDRSIYASATEAKRRYAAMNKFDSFDREIFSSSKSGDFFVKKKKKKI